MRFPCSLCHFSALVGLLLYSLKAFAAEKASPVAVKEDIVSTPTRILQNRYFLKSLRPEISVAAGGIINESYVNTYGATARLGLFVNEWIGLEYSYTKFSPQDSADLTALNQIRFCADGQDCRDANAERKSVEPSFSRMANLHAMSLVIAPVYGKINIFDWFIVYSDIYFHAGPAFVTTDKEKPIGGVVGSGLRFYFAKHWSLRFDASDMMFNETNDTSEGAKKSLRKSWYTTAGLSFFILE